MLPTPDTPLDRQIYAGAELIACLDVQYQDGSACAAAVLYNTWQDQEALAIHTAISHGHGGYQPGKFFERELGPLTALITGLPQPPAILVIDAYCTLSEDGSPGLGAYLRDALESKPAIIGVAKSRFARATHAVEVLRGTSSRPLFITALGMTGDIAADHIRAMHGPYRLPNLIKLADQTARAGLTVIQEQDQAHQEPSDP